MVPDTNDALLTFTYNMTVPYVVDETVAVFPNGQVWCWSLAAAGRQRRIRAGTFTFELDGAEREQAARWAESLLELAAQDAAPERGSPQVLVQAKMNGRQRTHLLSAAETERPELLQLVFVFGQELLARAEAFPLSVVQLDMSPRQDPEQAREAAALFTFESLGREPVSFLLQSDTFFVLSRSSPAGSSDRRMVNQDGRFMGLIDPRGRLRDGLNIPARLAPGEQALALFPAAIQSLPSSDSLVNGGVEGHLTLYNPGWGEGDFPDAPFVLVSRDHPLDHGS